MCVDLSEVQKFMKRGQLSFRLADVQSPVFYISPTPSTPSTTLNGLFKKGGLITTFIVAYVRVICFTSWKSNWDQDTRLTLVQKKDDGQAVIVLNSNTFGYVLIHCSRL